MSSLSVLSLRDIILKSIVEKNIEKSFVLENLCNAYGKKWLIDFLGRLSPKDLDDLLEDKEFYQCHDFCERIKSADFTKISYEVFAISIKYYDTGILKKRLLMKGKRLPPSIVWAIVEKMSDGLRKKFLRDNYVISRDDLIRLSEGKVGYRALRRKAISQNRKSINERFPFLSKKRRIEFSNELSNYTPIGQYKKENIVVNINGSEHTATLYAITMRDYSDPHSIPSDYGYIFIEFDGKYIEVFCKEFDADLDLREENFLRDTQAKLIDGDTETKVFVYYTDSFDDTDELHIHDSTNLRETFKSLVSLDIEFVERRGYRDIDYDDYFMYPYDYHSDDD
jgi:hypothetical protein